MDSATAQAMISASGLQMPQNSITLIIDASGVYYWIPIACINEPVRLEVNEAEDALKAKSMKQIEEKVMSLKVRSTKGDTEMKISNTLSILQFKEQYIKDSN